MSFTKILIANRGEIAVRIARTARAMGYRTVAVFSDADAGALHARVCDEAVRIGPAAVRESYLSIDAVLDAAQRTRADAVHPGYGFLSENEDFAAGCEAAGLVFIGPTPSAIAAMGNKAAAKRLMQAAGVACVPGYHGADQTDATLVREACAIGFPVMIKAAAGGGGRGMRVAGGVEDLEVGLSSARAEAMNAFGSGELILERAILNGRHIEIQVVGDGHGNIIHLGERDCSIQRRHQKVIEEAPSPAVSRELRERLGDAAIAAAQAVAYRGVGTVEFLLDQPDSHQPGAFYFLEMNTRLQVEHPVTEAVTGLDLVAWQLRIAAGERLPATQAQIRLDGHAIEARIYAESPSQGFLPQSGVIEAWRPATGLGIRIDHGLEPRSLVTSHYDPLLAKVIARGATREEARRRLVMALEDTVLLGIETNRAFLVDVLTHPEFVTGEATTTFIAKHFPSGSALLEQRPVDQRILALGAVLFYVTRQSPSLASRTEQLLSGWRSAGAGTAPIRVSCDGFRRDMTLALKANDTFTVCFEGEPELDRIIDIKVDELSQDSARFETNGLRQTAHFVRAGEVIHLQVGSISATIEDITWSPTMRQDAVSGDSRLLAPMNGKIVAVLAQVGDKVSKGQRIAVLEAMKMQHDLTASQDGMVTELAVREGDQVATRQLVASVGSA